MEQLEQKYLDSREVAEMVGREHKNVIRDIRNFADELGQLKIEPTDFFTESTYVTEQNKTMPCFMVTKKGCEFIAHKLTGIKGTEFTAKYINRFHDMEQNLSKPMSAMQLMELQFQAIKEVKADVDSVNKDLQDFKQDLPLLAVECEKITRTVKSNGTEILGGRNSSAYRDKSLRTTVYRDIHNEIRRQFGVDTYKAIKRSQCDKAIEIINNYVPPMVLAEQIADANAQISF